MSFEVNLIKVAPLDQLSGVDVFKLMVNAQHVAGEYWIFEGNVESLNIVSVVIVAVGVTEGTGDARDRELVRHCAEIFNVGLRDEPTACQMLSDLRRAGVG